MQKAGQRMQPTTPTDAVQEFHRTQRSELRSHVSPTDGRTWGTQQSLPHAGYAGNQATLRRLSRSAPHVQCKLQVGAVNDPLEAEADRVADQVMRMSDPGIPSTEAAQAVHRKCAGCEEEEDKKLHAKPAGEPLPGEAPPIVHDVLRSPGEPLDPATRLSLEPRFGAEFADVRLHTDATAAASAQAVNALAYTVGNHIVFGDGQYAPGRMEGHRLLAHELAHTMQQRGTNGVAAPPRNSRAPLVSSAPPTVSRAIVKLGNVSAEVDYGDLINVPVSGYVAAIQSRFLSYTGAALDPAVVAQITAFTPLQQEWVLYGLDVLSENTAQAPGLNRPRAFQRLVDRAPSSTTRALGTPSLAFEHEVLTTSGWGEEAISGGLTAPTATDLTVIDPLLNPPPDSSAPPGGVFDPVTFNAELPVLTTAVLSGGALNPANWPGARPQPLADVQSVGNAIQAQALSFFAPYADTARDNRWLDGWQYASQISSVTTDAAGAPRTIPRDERLSLIRNRATIAGQDDSSGPSLFSRVNFDSNRHDDGLAFDAVVAALEADPVVQPLVDDLLRHTGRTNRLTHEVGIATEVSTASSECTTRWNTIRTLCHELMHALAHPDFFAATTSSPRFPSGVTFDQVLVEGFAEVLGVQLFLSVRTKAAGSAGLLTQLTQGVAGSCTPPTTPITLGYHAAGANAQAILGQVGNDRFRAAYFHGRVSLIGL